MSMYVIGSVGPRELGATGFWKLASRTFGNQSGDPLAEHHLARMQVNGQACPDLVQILWYPKARKAQLSWRGKLVHTAAQSPKDAVERFFSLENKRLES